MVEIDSVDGEAKYAETASPTKEKTINTIGAIGDCLELKYFISDDGTLAHHQVISRTFHPNAAPGRKPLSWTRKSR